MSEFSKAYGFKQVTGGPHYPKSNGLAKRTVQTTKAMLEKSKDPHLALFSHHATALQWCGLSPAELLMGRWIRTTLPQVTQYFIPKWPYLKTFQQLDKKYKNQQKREYDRYHRACSLPELADDTPVWVRTDNLQQSGGVISTSDEPRSYVVGTPTGQVRRNQQHIIPIPTQEDPSVVDQGISHNEFQRSPVQTRSRTGRAVHPPDRLTF